MNFLKGSLFRRNTEPEELEPMEESGGGILAVWGSPGCGKTVTAVKIAKHLAAQKKNTVLLLCDNQSFVILYSYTEDFYDLHSSDIFYCCRTHFLKRR